MAVVVSGGLKTDNVAILNAIRNESSLEYRSRIPAATQANVTEVAQNIHKYRPQWNEFIGALVNRIGQVIVRDLSWTNPLAEFKRGMLEFGDTIEEIQVGLIEAKVYDNDREYMEKAIFGTERPHVESNFHTVNRQNMYKITVNENLLKRAFLESGGLSAFVSQLMQAPSTSDALDEFLLTVQLFSEYERNGGFYHVNVPDVRNLSSDGADARLALRKMRAMAETLPFISTKYNAAKMPTHAKKEELILFATPEYQAAIDVEALAGAFNIDKLEMSNRVITIPSEHFNIPGAQAILSTKDFFVIADQLFENTSMQNPVGLSTNYFLHHWQVVSASRFVPAVLFHTGADDEVIHINKAPTAISAITAVAADGTTVVATGGNVDRGLLYQFDATVTTVEAGGSQAIVWSVSGNTSNRTYITETGVLHVGFDEGATLLTIKATTAGFNDENIRDDAFSSTFTVVPVGAILPLWPAVGTVEAVEILGQRIAIVDGDNTYEVTTENTSLTKAEREAVQVISQGALSSSVTSAGNVVTVKVDPGFGKPERTLTFTLTAPVV